MLMHRTPLRLCGGAQMQNLSPPKVASQIWAIEKARKYLENFEEIQPYPVSFVVFDGERDFFRDNMAFRPRQM